MKNLEDLFTIKYACEKFRRFIHSKVLISPSKKTIHTAVTQRLKLLSCGFEGELSDKDCTLFPSSKVFPTGFSLARF